VTHFVMLANGNTPIHSRMWCVFEAHRARQERIPHVCISGKAEQLLTGSLAAELRVEEELAQAQQDEHEASIKDELEQRLRSPELLGDGFGLDRVGPQLQRFRDAAERVAHVKLTVLRAPDQQLVDLDSVECSSPSDMTMIRQEIAGEELQIIKVVTGLIRNVACGISNVTADARVAPGSLALSLDADRVDLRTTRFADSALLLLQLEGWLRLRPRVQQIFASAHGLGDEGVGLLRTALDEGMLSALEEIHVDDDASLATELHELLVAAQAKASEQDPSSEHTRGMLRSMYSV